MNSILLVLLVLILSTLLLPSFVRGFSSVSPPRKTGQMAQQPKQKQRRTNQQKSPLEQCLVDNSVLLLVDSNNVRGKTDFEWTHGDFMRLLREWKQRQISDNTLEIVCMVDHALRSEIVPYQFGIQVFAGPHRTADDLIAAATKWITDDDDSNATVMVITSDRELRQRCLQNNRPGKSKRKRKKPYQPQRDAIKAFDSPSFVRVLQAMRVDLDSRDDTIWDRMEQQCSILEDELRSFAFSRPPWACRSERQLAQEQGPWKSTVLGGESASLPRRIFSEKTWHRILVAEHWRRILLQQTTIPTPNCSDALNHYQERFQAHLTESRLDEEPTTTMFLDHRIESDPYQQQALLHYLDQAVYSNGEGTLQPEEETAHSIQAESCTALLRTLIRQANEEEEETIAEEELLARYRQEAPSRLLFSNPSDLKDLLHRIATRDEDGCWSLRDTTNALDDKPRPRAKRKMGRYRQAVDASLVETGQVMEARWLERIRYG